MDNMEIRRAHAEDAETFGRVHAAAWRAAYAGIIPQSHLATITPQSRTKLMLQGKAENTADYFLIYRKGLPAGVLVLTNKRDADLHRRTIEIAALYVLPQYWREGLGSALLSFAESMAKRAGFTALALWALAENTRARHFYKKHGFAADGAQRTIDRGRTLTQLRYGKPL